LEDPPQAEGEGADQDLVLTSPTPIAEIEFHAWTDDGKLRQPSYKCLRERQDNADINVTPD
jgi:bifunctional non-homologous end joining protein LigD